MDYNNSKGLSYIGSFFVLIGTALVGLFLATLLNQQIWHALTGTQLTDAARTGMKNPAFTTAFRVIQAVFVVCGMLLPTILVARLQSKQPFKELGLTRPLELKALSFALLLMFLSIFIAGALGYLNMKLPIPQDWRLYFQKMESEYMDQVTMIVGSRSFNSYLSSLLLLALLPAICEEVFFRGGLQQLLTNATRKPMVAILIVSLLFSLVHFSFFGFLPRMFLGISLGLIYYYTGNLWLSILGHFLNNALALTKLYYSGATDMQKAMNDDFPFYYGFLAIPVFIWVLLQMKKLRPRALHPL